MVVVTMLATALTKLFTNEQDLALLTTLKEYCGQIFRTNYSGAQGNPCWWGKTDPAAT